MIATATVTNTGKRRATEIVQCYVNIRGASTEQPVRNLKGFARITLDPGQSQEVHFPLGSQNFRSTTSRLNRLSSRLTIPFFIGGSSTTTNAAHFTTTP